MILHSCCPGDAKRRNHISKLVNIKRNMAYYRIICPDKKVFVKMKKLRLLKVYTSYGDGYKMTLPNDFEFPPNLRYIYWEGLESLPLNFNGKNLVAINLKSSNMKELWESDKV